MSIGLHRSPLSLRFYTDGWHGEFIASATDENGRDKRQFHFLVKNYVGETTNSQLQSIHCPSVSLIPNKWHENLKQVGRKRNVHTNTVATTYRLLLYLCVFLFSGSGWTREGKPTSWRAKQEIIILFKIKLCFRVRKTKLPFSLLALGSWRKTNKKIPALFLYDA